MKEYKIKYDQKAIRDMMSIISYLEYNLLNSKASKKFFENIKNKILNLKTFPYMGKIYIDNQNRYLVYKNFYIFYKIQENENIINIIRIIHKNKIIF